MPPPHVLSLKFPKKTTNQFIVNLLRTGVRRDNDCVKLSLQLIAFVHLRCVKNLRHRIGTCLGKVQVTATVNKNSKPIPCEMAFKSIS
jgi:hypothetical protein